MALGIGIVGCGRIFNAHLRGLKLLKDRRLADFTITALCSRNIPDALMFRSPADGVPPRPPVTDAPHNGLSAPHHYISDLQSKYPACPTTFGKWRPTMRSTPPSCSRPWTRTTKLVWPFWRPASMCSWRNRSPSRSRPVGSWSTPPIAPEPCWPRPRSLGFCQSAARATGRSAAAGSAISACSCPA